MDFFWTAPQSLEHAVTLAPWNDNLLVPSALSPIAYSYTIGASGLAVQPVDTAAGMKGGFVGSAADGFGGAWLVGYRGDVTYLSSVGISTAYDIPASASGDIFIGAALCQGSPYFVAANGDIFTVDAGAVTAVLPGFGEPVSSLTSDLSTIYAILPESGNLATYTLGTPVTGSFTTVPVPMDVPAFAVAGVSGIAVGGSSNSVIPVGAVSFKANPFAPNTAAAVDTVANNVYLLTGPEPDWSLNNAVSGTGAPADLAWASAGEQILVADTLNDEIEVFNLVTGVLVPFQTLAVSGVTNVAATSDGMTALATQPTFDQVSVLGNTANLWSVTSSVAVTGANVAIGLSDTEFVIGGLDALSWVQRANNGWLVVAAVSGLTFTPSSLATDGNGVIFAAGTHTSGTAHLVAASQNGILATSTWAGTGDSVLFEQAQIAVADGANSLIRVFAYEGGALTQKATAAGPAGIRAIGTTPPSLWACGASGMAQLAFTAPFELDHQPLGVVAIYRNSAWVSGATGVLNQPTAAAWDVSGTVWAATQQDMLNRFSLSAQSVSGVSLAPYRANSQVPIGISSMLWWHNGLFAVSSLNSSLMEVSGSASPGVPGVVPGVLLGINFVIGESFYQ